MTLSRTTLLAILALAGGVVAAFTLSRPPVQPLAPLAVAAAKPAASRWLDPALTHSAPVHPAPVADGLPESATEAAAYGRNGRPLDLHGQTVAQYIADRIGRARTGDVRAAYEVYQAESLCAAIDEPLPEFADDNDRKIVEQQRGKLRALCGSVSAVQMQERMAFLAKAADSGNRDAQIDYFMEGPGGKPIDWAANTDDPQVQNWKAAALRYLQQAGDGCDHFALSLLANVYDAGLMVPHDGRMTMAYSMASAAARNRSLSIEQLKSRFGEELPEADFTAALQMGAHLTQQACPGR